MNLYLKTVLGTLAWSVAGLAMADTSIAQVANSIDLTAVLNTAVGIGSTGVTVAGVSKATGIISNILDQF